jgi:pimeloyl-ACP methyl ester carboxylesterase
MDVKPNDPLLNLKNCRALDGLYGTYPIGTVRAAYPGVIGTNDYTSFSPLSTVCPPSVWAYGGGTLCVWVGGTSGRIHLPQLLAGWNSVYDNWESNRGACSAFANAARSLITGIGPEIVGQSDKIYLVGHSYGGAVCQAFAALAFGSTQPRIKVWSYGGPRPGLFRLGTVLQSCENTRFYTDDDPVRFIPPHSSEVPALTALEQWDFIRQCNTQVQCPTGWQLESEGKMVQTEGNPTVLHSVAASIADWCMDTNGFRSVNHALSNYIQRFTLAYNSLNPQIETSNTTVREREEVLTIRQRDSIAAVGEIDIAAALQTQPNFNTEFTPGAAPINSTLRYRRRKVGRVWGVKYGDEVVAIGPGKRAALKLARAFNRAAQAHW